MKHGIKNLKNDESAQSNLIKLKKMKYTRKALCAI